MTDERTPARDPRSDPGSTEDRPTAADRDGQSSGSTKSQNPNPWTREGADAPDAADIEQPKEQR
jgi:hypothetical protein